MKPRSLVLRCTVLALLASGCLEDARDTIDVPVEAAAPIVGGAPDTINGAVVLLIIQDDLENPTWQGNCTGTVVAPHVVLTAAHCFAEDVTGFAEVEVAVFIGDDIDDPDQGNDAAFYRYEERHGYDPAFDVEQPLGDGHDVGFVVTDSAFPETPIAMNRLAPPAVGTSMHLVGYGKRDASDVDSFGSRQMTDAPIASVEADHLIFEGSGMCGGDSGGPSLWRRGDASYVAGIHSYIEGVATCSGKGYDLTVDDAVLAYIDPVIEDADPGFLASQPPQVPDDGSGGAGGVGGATATSSSTATGLPPGNEATGSTGTAPPPGDEATGGADSGGGGGETSDGDDVEDDGGCTIAAPARSRSGAFAIAIAVALLGLGARRRSRR